MNNLLLEFHDTIDDNFTKGSGRIYAMVFNPLTEEAIDFSAAPPYALAAFDGVQSRFSKLLSSGNYRTKYYSFSIPSASLDLADVDYGDEYTIEYWAEAASGVQDRSTDSFLGFEKFIWKDDIRVEHRISLAQENDIALAAAILMWNRLKTLASAEPGSMGEYLTTGIAQTTYTAFCANSYDSETSRVYFRAWLEKDSELQLDALSALVTLYDSTNTVVAQVSSTAIDANGSFLMSADSIALSPDETYFQTCEITDAGGETRTTGGCPVTWD